MDSLVLENLLGKKIENIEIFLKNDNTYQYTILEKVIFYLDDKALILTPVVDTDEIKIDVYDAEKTVFQTTQPHILSKFIGLNLNYTWNGINTKGYFDVFLMSFHNLTPSLMILSEGSSLKLFFLEQT
jgi:hypothetical protein